ncbi:MAG: serine/threonine-protein kinase [Myxococcota bacterium]
MNPDAEVVPVTPDMAVTETLGGYDLLRRLGAGGMAEVHLARHNAIEGFQKLVVLKQILPHLSRDRHFVRMFLGEARVAALLDHPNIVQVFDLGREEDDYYFTMEFVYGENLTGLLKAIRKSGMVLPLEHAVTIARGAACGLHYAHERVGFDGRPLGIVHRDVSPTNVMITYEGGVKVADFGIAKVITRTDVTRAGIRKGKVPYMSPEQCRADQIDRRSDIFSLGIVMYEMLTGDRLFDGDNEFGVMNTIVNGTIAPPSTKRAGLPKELDRIIGRALTRDKSKRYQTARELQLELEAFAREANLRAQESALGELMHHLFRPQPFPWGALMGHGVSNATHLHTIAESSHGSVSGSGVRIPSRTDVTSGGGGRITGSSSGSNVARGTVVTSADRRRGTLRGIAIGLGAVAAAAAVLVLGLYMGGRGVGGLGREDVPQAAPAEASKPAQAAAVAAPPAAQPASAEPAPGDPRGGPVIPSGPPPQAEPPAAEAAPPVAETPTPIPTPVPTPVPTPEAKAAPKPAPAEAEPAPKPKPVVKKKKKKAPAPTKKKKKKVDPDSFMGM